MAVYDGTKTTKTNGIIINTGTGLPFTAHHTRTTFQTPQRRSSLFNLQRCSLATVLEDSQFQRALARHSQRCLRFAVTLVADSMGASGLAARDSRSARARPRAGRGALVGHLPLARPQHGQVQRGLGPDVATMFTLAVTLVADSMDAPGLTARDSRSARARPRHSIRAAFASAT